MKVFIENYLDGFSGYGGFHKGFENAGYEFGNVYYSEIDKYAIANYSYNFPTSKYAGSITTISRDNIPSIDLFTFGWPCQDNSIAGKRKGQRSGTRSGLLYESVRIINEFKPRNFVAENVAGLLTVNKGIDIIESLKVLAYLNESCPQYDIEMQLLNTRWVLPQNRERLYFIGHLRGSGSRQIFPIGESIGEICETWHGKDFAGCLSTRNASGQCQFDGSTTLIQKKKIQIGTWRTRPEDYGFREMSDEISPSLLARAREDAPPVIIEDGIPRRLTPIECERLQGLPDNWTRHGTFDGILKEQSDTQRYKLCGNGVSVPIVELIANALKSA